MTLNTCAEVISLAKMLETESARFYKDLSQKYPDNADVWQSFARENQQNIVNVERAYYGVITDAIEGCFAFNIDPSRYEFKTAPAATLAEAVGTSIKMEEQIVRFYSEAAEQAKSLMADVPRAFVSVAKKRSNRLAKLRALIGG